MSTGWQPTSEQHTQIFAELGRCLYVYQSIEVRLKLILPHLSAPGEEIQGSNEGFGNWKIFLSSKATLGPLMQRLKERVTTDDPELLFSAWTQLVIHRNEVIHHFLEQPFARVASEADFVDALNFLRHRRAAAVPLLEALQHLCGAFIDAIDLSAAFGESAELQWMQV